MNNSKLLLLIPGLILALTASAQSNGKVGIINLQAAIGGTKDGQKAANDLQQRYGPRRADLEKRQADVQQLQEKLGKATTDEERAQLTREIDQKTKSINRDREDAQAELDQEEQKILNDLGGKVQALCEKYAKDHGYSWIVDVSSQQTPVIYYSEQINITKDIIDLYDKNASAPGTGTPTAKPIVPSPKPGAPAK